ncbi:MAG TPA: LytTR family DNA-binding domain-containing protein [Saprospiraceae bacterium]|nr:LytTR family DNA-binding domain-containing protein [Saprospiraceae bacterium]
MKHTCIIVDDEPLARNLLSEYVQKVPELELMKAFGNPLEALNFLREKPVDILFLDIQMPELTGISLLKILQNKPAVILTTAYSQYAIESYEHDVTDYLLKPITFERFIKSVEKAKQQLDTSAKPSEAPSPSSADKTEEESQSDPSFIFVKDGRKLVKVNLADIQYIEGMKDYVRIHTQDRKITSLQRLKALEEELPSKQFIRVHHSYIVGVAWIEEIERERIFIGKHIIPVSDTYRKPFQEFIENQQFL